VYVDFHTVYYGLSHGLSLDDYFFAFFGERTIRWINQQIREKTKLPIPHVVPLDRDGNRYGIDSEADLM